MFYKCPFSHPAANEGTSGFNELNQSYKNFHLSSKKIFPFIVQTCKFCNVFVYKWVLVKSMISLNNNFRSNVNLSIDQFSIQFFPNISKLYNNLKISEL